MYINKPLVTKIEEAERDTLLDNTIYQFQQWDS